ncbi:hypothetical protein COLO4_33966 [Corchorus olitorius]|uniref:Uncharacterized protein n=1 Tax=Corchorus olitorius TaxID=93759 RepID=A0A1R3GPV5_9ROSI|nr:hypothetical protein COLO4_33966 [Corchorus olitorius]
MRVATVVFGVVRISVKRGYGDGECIVKKIEVALTSWPMLDSRGPNEACHSGQFQFLADKQGLLMSNKKIVELARN